MPRADFLAHWKEELRRQPPRPLNESEESDVRMLFGTIGQPLVRRTAAA